MVGLFGYRQSQKFRSRLLRGGRNGRGHCRAELSVREHAEEGHLILKGSWDLVTRVIIRVTILITPIRVLIITYLLSPMSPQVGLRGGNSKFSSSDPSLKWPKPQSSKVIPTSDSASNSCEAAVTSKSWGLGSGL